MNPGVGCPGVSVWGEVQANPALINPETRCRAVLGEVTDPMLPRKASSELTRCPYPKPTQVGG